METWTIGINPLVTLWLVTIVGGVACIGWGLLRAGLHPYNTFEDAIREQGSIPYGLVLVVVGSLSWGLWHSYYAC